MTPDRKRYILVLGLDYGTSYSKMIIREDNQRQACTVTGRDGNYLFPSVFGYREDCLYAPLCDPCPNAVAFLKMSAPAIAFNPDENHKLPTSLSCLLQEGNKAQRIKALLAWQFCGFLVTALDFLKNRSRWKDYDPARDVLFVNLGLPLEHMQCQSTKDLFLGALAAAWEMAPICELLANGNARADLTEWEEACNQTEWPPADPAKNVLYLYEEVAAGVQSVMRSPTANDGLYMTFDVGSGTLDSNTFRRLTKSYSDDEPANKLSYYAARVSNLGMTRLADHGGHHIFSGFPHLKNAITDDYTEQGLAPDDFFREVTKELEALRILSFSKCPNHSKCINNPTRPNKTWDDCRIYGFGGGMHNKAYRSHLEDKLRAWINHANIINLPVPRDLEMPPEADYSRLGIAYGLSFPIANLEKITPPSENPDRPPVQRRSCRPEKPGNPGFSTLD